MPIRKYKDNYKEWVLYTSAATVVLTGLFKMLFYGNTIANYVFSTGGTWMTIIGLGIGIWQIGKLRDEEEIVQSTRIKSRLSYIKRTFEYIQENLLNSPSINENLVYGYIAQLDRVQHELFEIELEDIESIDCMICKKKVTRIILDLHQDIASDALATFRRQHYNMELNDVIENIGAIEFKV